MKRPAIAGSQTQDTSVSALPLSHDSRITTNPHIYCICTAQVVLNASVAHPVATQHVQYIQKIVGVSGCLALMAAEHWWLKPSPGFASRRLLLPKFIYFQREARCSEQLGVLLCVCVHVDIPK